MNPFESLGRLAVSRMKASAEALAFLGETAVYAIATLRHPRYFRLGDAALAFERMAFDGLPITIGIGFLLGVILAFQSAAALQIFGLEVYVSDLLSIALFRELGPLITAIILAGRSGSAFAAEIGTMKVDEELDALTTMGLPPVRFLVLPRVVMAVLAMPLLTIFNELSGLIGGAIVLDYMRIPTEVYWRHIIASTSAVMIIFGLLKGAFFGLLVGIIGCSAGMRTKAAADGVGKAATSAVVDTIVAIAIWDGVLAVLSWLWKI